MKFLVNAVFLLSASCLGYSICNPTVYPYSSEEIKISLVQTVTRTIRLGNLTITIAPISGSIQIEDGCTFTVNNLTLASYPQLNFQWYGGFKQNAIDAVSLSETAIVTGNGTTDTSQTFTFKRAAGSAVSFLDFDQFRLFETRSKSLLATADLPPNSQVVAPTTRNTTTSGSNPSTTGTNPEGGNNSAFGVYPSAGLLLAVLITLFA
jgi:hypothetical protein